MDGPLKYETSIRKNIGKLPPECYDTIDGYLNPATYVIHSYEDGKEVRRPDQKERSWIADNCRVGEKLTVVEVESGDLAGIHPIHLPAAEQSS